jgi:hypothetical protein
MELIFEPVQVVGAGASPNAIHTPENVVQLIYTSTNGSIYAKNASTPMGEWTDLIFGTGFMICDDINAEYMKLHHGASAIFVVWKNATEEGETVPYAPGIVHTVRHRIAVWMLRQDLTKYLVNGNLTFRLDDPVSTISLTFENPSYIVSHEQDTLLTPGTNLNLYFRSGDSLRFVMGKYFVDRNSMGVMEGTTEVEASNTIGKLLRDQSFDDDHTYTLRNLEALGIAILESFGVIDYFVSTTTASVGMEFPPDMKGLDGLEEVIKTTMTWKLAENMNGQIGFGPKTDSRFAQPSTYTFYRDKDIFSRNVTRDDQNAYSRVCIFNETRTIQVYRDVDFKFVMGRKKTLHVPTAKETTLEHATIYADELAVLLKNVGIIETFTGPFRPYLLVGDDAAIINNNNTKILGLITSVIHRFGKTGFFTEFTVDSGSTSNKTRISDYITKIAGKQVSSQAKRLY